MRIETSGIGVVEVENKAKTFHVRITESGIITIISQTQKGAFTVQAGPNENTVCKNAPSVTVIQLGKV